MSNYKAAPWVISREPPFCYTVGMDNDVQSQIHIIVDDITTVKADAIVNAANVTLLGGGGVDGAIHTAAGPDLLAECQSLDGCDTGDAKITAGYDLPAHHVIHTVGPIWHGGTEGEDALLKSCYLRSMELASQLDMLSIAFPAISTGAYAFPPQRAAEIALKTAMEFLTRHDRPKEITFCCFTPESATLHKQALARLEQP